MRRPKDGDRNRDWEWEWKKESRKGNKFHFIWHWITYKMNLWIIQWWMVGLVNSAAFWHCEDVIPKICMENGRRLQMDGIKLEQKFQYTHKSTTIFTFQNKRKNNIYTHRSILIMREKRTLARQKFFRWMLPLELNDINYAYFRSDVCFFLVLFFFRCLCWAMGGVVRYCDEREKLSSRKSDFSAYYEFFWCRKTFLCQTITSHHVVKRRNS